jgi:dihydrodipicolinate synthase/N-acetylneuraminate lyase
MKLEGIVPILPVPFHEDESIDEESLRRLVDYCLREGAGGVCLPAYASEFYKLSEQERVDLVRIVAEEAKGRIPVVGQANHGSPSIALQLAQAMEAAGADVISLAAPRVFAIGDEDLVRYFKRIGEGLRIPILVQDFNPGGPTVGPGFAARLQSECPNFKYLKLEDPLMGPRIRAILVATDGEIGVLEGWGGMYLMELIPCGICGVMPGTPLLRLLKRAWDDRRAGRDVEAYAAYQTVLPFIVFTLQHMELFLHIEKRLLQRMGLIRSAKVRDITITPDADSLEYGEWLIEQLLPSLR